MGVIGFCKYYNTLAGRHTRGITANNAGIVLLFASFDRCAKICSFHPLQAAVANFARDFVAGSNPLRSKKKDYLLVVLMRCRGGQ